MNIWTVDQPAIREEVRQRNVLRRSALLPLLNEQKEFDHACDVIRQARFLAFRKSKQADYDRIYAEVVAGRGRPNSFMGAWVWHTIANKKFVAFLNATYRDEMASMMRIAPDYLAITRQVIEQIEAASTVQMAMMVMAIAIQEHQRDRSDCRSANASFGSSDPACQPPDDCDEKDTAEEVHQRSPAI